MPENVNVNELSDSDILADVAALVSGAETIDGIDIDDCDYDDTLGRLFITLVDDDGNTRTATFAHVDN